MRENNEETIKAASLSLVKNSLRNCILQSLMGQRCTNVMKESQAEKKCGHHLLEMLMDGRQGMLGSAVILITYHNVTDCYYFIL